MREKGESWEAPGWWWLGLGPPPSPQFSWREGGPWQGWALLLWLLALLGRASDQVALLPFGLDLREHSPRAESPIKKKKKSLPG